MEAEAQHLIVTDLPRPTRVSARWAARGISPSRSQTQFWWTLSSV